MVQGLAQKETPPVALFQPEALGAGWHFFRAPTPRALILNLEFHHLGALVRRVETVAELVEVPLVASCHGSTYGPRVYKTSCTMVQGLAQKSTAVDCATSF
jgi:hypothetical protein